MKRLFAYIVVATFALMLALPIQGFAQSQNRQSSRSGSAQQGSRSLTQSSQGQGSGTMTRTNEATRSRTRTRTNTEPQVTRDQKRNTTRQGGETVTP